MKRLSTLVPSSVRLFAATLLAGLPAAQALDVAGSLVIDLDAADYVNDGSGLWNQHSVTSLSGSFSATGAPLKETIGGGVGVVFDGGAEYFTGPLTLGSPLEGTNPTHSVEVWVYQGNVKAEESLVTWGRRGSDRQNMSYNYGTSTGAAGFGAIGHWGTAADLGWGTVPAAGQWHHIVYSYNGSTTNVYVDGALNATEATGNLNPFSGYTLNLGVQHGNNANGDPDLGQILSGTIGKVRIHSGALDATGALNNFNAEKAQFQPAAAAAVVRAPLHRYSFNNAAGAANAGAVIVDSITGVNGMVKGVGAMFTGAAIDLTGGASSSSPYVDLANGLISGKGTLTLEFWATQQSNQTWSRIFDFGSGTAGEINDVGGTANGNNYIFLSGNINGAADQRLERVGGTIANGNTNRDSIGTTTLNVEHHYAVTYDDILRQWRWFRDGVVMDTLPDTAGPTTIADVNNWIGRSQWTGDANWDGLMNEFRIYNYALTEAQVKGSMQAGANTLNASGGLVAWQPVAGGTFDFRAATANNWGGGVGVFPNLIDATALIASDLTGNQIIELNGGVTIGALSIGDVDGSNKFLLAAGAGGVLTMQVSVGGASIAQVPTSGGDTISAPVVLNSNTELSNFSATNTFTISGAISGAGNLSKGGAGVVDLTGDNSAHTGAVTVASGQLRVGAGGTTGTLGSGAITVNGNGRLVFNRSDSTTVSANISGTGQIGQESTGSVTYTGTATHTGVTDLNGGTFVLQGSIIGTQSLQVDNNTTLDAGSFVSINGWLGLGSGTGGNLTVKPGATLTASGDFNVGDVGGGSSYLNIEGGSLGGRTLYVGKNVGTNGVVVQSGGDMFASAGAGDWRIGGGFAGTENVYGSWRITGGTFNTSTNFQIGAFGFGLMEIDGGSVTTTAGFPVVGRFQNGTAESNGVLDIKSGSFNSTNTGTKLIVAEEGNGTVNVRGTGVLNAVGGIWIGHSNTGGPGTGILNVGAGGVVNTPQITQNLTIGYGELNLDGGTIRASAAATNFLEFLDAAYVRAGGATFDTNGFDITIVQPLLAPSGDGVVTIPVLTGGSGYKGSPMLTLSGGGGTGATAVANLTAGVVTSITVTNPGVDYASAPTVAIQHDGFGSGFTIDPAAVALAANASGGFTKVGTGTLTLSAMNTYTGPTVINAGVLALGEISSIAASSLTTINPTGTLTGEGTAGAVKLAGGTLAPGFDVGVLNTGNLEFAGGTFLVQLDGAFLVGFDYDQVNVAGTVKITAPTELSLSVNTQIYEPAEGDSFVLVLNDGLEAVTLNSLFTFGGTPLADGAIFGSFSNSNGSLAFQLDYSAGEDGNDVVLSVVPEPGSAALLLAGLGLLGARRRRSCAR